MAAKENPTPNLQLAFGRALRQVRTDRGLSQEELAFESEVHRTYISELERGQKNPSLATVERLSHALGVKVSELIAGAESLLKRR